MLQSDNECSAVSSAALVRFTLLVEVDYCKCKCRCKCKWHAHSTTRSSICPPAQQRTTVEAHTRPAGQIIQSQWRTGALVGLRDDCLH